MLAFLTEKAVKANQARAGEDIFPTNLLGAEGYKQLLAEIEGEKNGSKPPVSEKRPAGSPKNPQMGIWETE